MTACVAVDLGGTRIKAGLVEDGVVVDRLTLESESAAGLAAKLPELAALIDGMLGDVHPDFVGMAMPGIVDRRTSRLVAVNAKWSDATGIDLARWVREHWNAAFLMENDAVAALAGEWHFGAGRGFDSVVMMTLGTGIGVATVVEGRILRGTHGQAAIAGHLTVAVDGRPCNCGNIGCAEAEASGWALPGLAKEAPGFAESALRDEPVIDYAAVFRLAPTDRLARELRDRSVRVWSALAVSLVHAFDPEVIIVGGGVAAAGAPLFEPLTAYIRDHAWTPWGVVDVRSAALGSDAALLGLSAIWDRP